MIKVGGQSMTFMVATGAEHSMVTTPVDPLTGRTATIVGAILDMAARSFCKAHLCQLGGHLVIHNFFTYWDAPFPCWVETYRQSWGHKSPLPLESL